MMLRYLSALLILIFSSCTYDRTYFEPNPALPRERIQSLLDGLVVTSKPLIFSAEIADTLFQKSGLRIIKSKDDICNLDGKVLNAGVNPLYCNKLKVELTELQTKGEFILQNLFTTTTNDTLLQCEKAIKVSIDCDFNPLYITSNESIEIQSPSNKVGAPYYVFYGTKNKVNRNIAISRGIDSLGNKDQAQFLSWPTANSNVVDGYQFFSRRLGWILLAQKYPTTAVPLDKVQIKLSGGFEYANSRVFVIVKNANVVAECKYNFEDNLFYLNNLPIDEEIEVISLSSSNNAWYLGRSSEKFNPSQTVLLSVKAATVQEINDLLLK